MTRVVGLAVGSQTKQQRTVLVVSPHFPPSTLAGVHRARHLAKYLPSYGWWPIIIRVDEAHYTERPDPNLAALVPDSVEQVRTGALPAGLLWLAGIGDIGLRGFMPIKRAIAKVAAARQPAAILITGSPFYPMLLSAWVRQHLGIPVVLDFQDPWVSAQGATHPRWSKRGIVHRLADALERRAVHQADFITSVSDRQNGEMARRYPWLDRRRMAAIPIGGDPDDFRALRASPPCNPQVLLDPRWINLSFVGTCLPRAGPLIRALFRAVRHLKHSHPELASKLRLNFVGTSNQPDQYDAYLVRPIAEDEGVDDLVYETPQRVPFLEALHILANSQGLLLIGSDEAHYTASKIYPALISGRPYLSLFHHQSSAHAILSKAGGGRAIGFDAGRDLSSLIESLKVALVEVSTTPERLGRANPETYEAYTAKNISQRFAEIFDSVVARERWEGRRAVP